MDPVQFTCLDPRKAKRATIDQMLRPGGSIAWLRLAPMRLRGWPEAQDAASAALAMSKDRKQNTIMRWLHLSLLKLQYNGTRAYFQKHSDHVAVCWNGLNGTRRVFMQAAKAAGAKTLFFELAPFPGRITIDPCGVNNANSLPRRIKPYQDWFTQAAPQDWRAIQGDIIQRAPLRPADTPDAPPLTDPFLFVPLQTPGDSQLRLFGGAFPTVDGFIDALTQAAKHLPDGWHLRIKEHPTAPVSFTDKIRAALPNRIYLDNANDTFAQVAASRGVITVNSSVGIEAMFYDKPVVACGQCFWAIDDIATQAKDTNALIAVMQHPDALVFDPTARNAFLSFLDQCYYPHADHADFTQIAARLGGVDRFGFWGSAR